MSDDRLATIESKLAFLEDLVQTLNEEVSEQQRQIESLRVMCKHVSDQNKTLIAAMDEGGDQDERPPHY